MSRWFKTNKKTRTVEVDILTVGASDIDSLCNKSKKELDRMWNKGQLNTEEKLFSRTLDVDDLMFGPK